MLVFSTSLVVAMVSCILFPLCMWVWYILGNITHVRVSIQWFRSRYAKVIGIVAKLENNETWYRVYNDLK